MSNKRRASPYPSARQGREEAARARPTPQTASPTYRLAFTDEDFIVREELRPVRLQLELLKPELTFQEHGVQATVSVFGSARIPDPEVARAAVDAAKQALEAAPEDEDLKTALARAEKRVERSRFYDIARELGRLIGTYGDIHPHHKLVALTGGGPGIMEACNRGACEAGGETVGLNITLPFEQAPNRWITPELSFQFHYFAIRKMHFLIRAHALVCFPGGFGTMDELFETLTLIQTRKMEPIPILLFNEAWWHKIINFGALVEEEVISPEDLRLFKFVETAEEAWDIIVNFERAHHTTIATDNGAGPEEDVSERTRPDSMLR